MTSYLLMNINEFNAIREFLTLKYLILIEASI